MQQHPASYRDPSGFVYTEDNTIFRYVDSSYQQHFDTLISSGLYSYLEQQGRMLPFKILESGHRFQADRQCYKVLQPLQLDFWSYSYEWCFEQLQDAAQLTLQLMKDGLNYGMILKDAKPENIQFLNGKPLLVDSLSFELYQEGPPWIAHNQFCKTFLYPLLLQAHAPGFDCRMLLAYPEGIAADMAASLLPARLRLSVAHQLYVFLPAALSRKQHKRGISRQHFSKAKLLYSIEQLLGIIKKLKPNTARSVWNNYYSETVLSNAYVAAKEQIIEHWLKEINPVTVTDAGANTGNFTRLADKYAQHVISMDSDERSVAALYKQSSVALGMHVLYADLCTPSPATGWLNNEHKDLLSRLRCDTCLALALIHHIAIGRNVPLPLIAAMFSRITSKHLIAEFIPKDDPKVQLLLSNREDIFKAYDQQHFEQSFGAFFTIVAQKAVQNSSRIL